jgi:hypothetical protein
VGKKSARPESLAPRRFYSVLCVVYKDEPRIMGQAPCPEPPIIPRPEPLIIPCPELPIIPHPEPFPPQPPEAGHAPLEQCSAQVTFWPWLFELPWAFPPAAADGQFPLMAHPAPLLLERFPNKKAMAPAKRTTANAPTIHFFVRLFIELTPLR